MKQYAVKEIYYTLQGEGAQAGRAAVFCRFAGCNLWSGLEKDRAAAVCKFCDTNFVGTDGPGGGVYSAGVLAAEILAKWPEGQPGAMVVFTGGEPLLQLDTALVAVCHGVGLRVAVETNGTRPAPVGIDWLCVSPKAGQPLTQQVGHELKLVFPQVEADAHPSRYENLGFEHFFLQPKDGPDAAANTLAAIDYCMRHPKWRLSVQTHKVVGLP